MSGEDSSLLDPIRRGHRQVGLEARSPSMHPSRSISPGFQRETPTVDQVCRVHLGETCILLASHIPDLQISRPVLGISFASPKRKLQHLRFTSSYPRLARVQTTYVSTGVTGISRICNLITYSWHEMSSVLQLPMYDNMLFSVSRVFTVPPDIIASPRRLSLLFLWFRFSLATNAVTSNMKQ